jgi:hypothetical protein
MPGFRTLRRSRPSAEATPKARANRFGAPGMSGPDVTGTPDREGSALNRAVPGAGSRTGENPPYGIFGRAAGNVTTGAGLRPTAKGVDWPPDPTVDAPVFYPTGRDRRAAPLGGTRRSTSRLRSLSP